MKSIGDRLGRREEAKGGPLALDRHTLVLHRWVPGS